MELRDTDFEDMVLKSDRPVLVDFWASWCPPCKMMQPVVDKLSVKVGDWADVYSINIDRNPALAQQYQVSGVPTFIAYAGGEVIDRKTGALTEGQLTGLLKKAEEAMPPAATVECELSDEECTEDGFYDDAESYDAADDRPGITIVSGLPRSGTSMMMRMLEAGGVPALTDEQRTPDEDNPNGYYEFEDVKSIENYGTWIDRAPGHSVKMVYSLLKHLPADREYRILFMRRNVDEILQSQKTMLDRNGVETEIPDATMKALFERELRQFYAWLPSQAHLNLVNISYNDLITNPRATIDQINRHLDESLDTEAMIRLVDPSLYRNRAA